jgi:methyl-accepting chemotaxis protein
MALVGIIAILLSLATFIWILRILRQMLAEIRAGVNVLGSSGSEIMATTAQVAAGAAETATAVSETTTTVEEVKQTAQVSSQKAKFVLERAQKAVETAQNGKQSVAESLGGMQHIREQMGAVADSIVRLSEQSQAIGDIIGVVNDLADQSNLLAVNAAIEAAKAGEQGKGFAVVAQEIRSLAEQSKQATTQVRGLLGSIQKAVSQAVLATEQGTKAVEGGAKLAGDVGEVIRQLADSITEASQAATQIAASSQQQFVGIDQVVLARENIKQASAENASSTKQAEEVAGSLNELGQQLKQLLKRYQV